MRAIARNLLTQAALPGIAVCPRYRRAHAHYFAYSTPGIITSEQSSGPGGRTTIYIAVVAAFLLVVSIVYLQHKARQRRHKLLKNFENLEKENWLTKARGEDSESLLKKRLRDFKIDPSTKNLDTLEDRVKVGMEIKLADLAAEVAEYKELDTPRVLKVFSILPLAMQKEMLDDLQSHKQLMTQHESELREGLYEFKDKLPNIASEFSSVAAAFQEFYKTLDQVMANWSGKMAEKGAGTIPNSAQTEFGVDFSKDDLSSLDAKYSPIKDAPPTFKDFLADVKQHQFTEAVSMLGKIKESVAAGTLAQKEEFLEMTRGLKAVLPNYGTVFQKYLGNYPDLLGAIGEFNKAVDGAAVEVQQSIERERQTADPNDIAIRDKGKIRVAKPDAVPSHVLTQKGIVVTYRFDGTPQGSLVLESMIHGFTNENPNPDDFIYAATDKRLRAILEANPNVDLTKFENVYGIKIVDVQRQNQPLSGINIGNRIR